MTRFVAVAASSRRSAWRKSSSLLPMCAFFIVYYDRIWTWPLGAVREAYHSWYPRRGWLAFADREPDPANASTAGYVGLGMENPQPLPGDGQPALV